MESEYVLFLIFRSDQCYDVRFTHIVAESCSSFSLVDI